MHMKKIIFLTSLLFNLSMYSQNAEVYQKVLQIFQENINAQNIEPIYNLYTRDTQEEMTKEGITRFIKGIYQQFGSFQEYKFLTAENSIYQYTATFDKTTLVLELLLNTNGQIETIQFREP